MLVILIMSASAFADIPSSESVFTYEILKPGKKRSSVYWHPLASFLLPGLAQYSNKQTAAGIVYSAYAGIGIGVAIANSPSKEEQATPGLRTDLTDKEKAAVWGLQSYQTAGSVSAYHAFRSVAKQRQAVGDFKFLTVEETPDQLMFAPFDLNYFTKPTSYIPLGILTAGLIYYHNNEGGLGKTLTASDGLFSVGVSYNAGVGEEALFRGYLMMNLRQSWGDDFWANAATATIFALGHVNEQNRYALPQLVLGYYLGWVTQRNQWTLAESIFIHTWWDIIAISAALAEGVTNQTLYLPVLALTF